MCQQLLPGSLYSWNMEETFCSSSCVYSPGPQMGKQFWETGTFGTWASLGTHGLAGSGLWRCHVSSLVLAFRHIAKMGQPHAPSNTTSAIPTAMCFLPWRTEKLWSYETKTKQKPFPLILLLPDILSQWQGDCFSHCSHPLKREPWCSRWDLSTALTMVTNG